MLRDAVRGIATSYGAPYMRECIAEERPPVELWDELGKGGFLGVNLPTEYGGGGMGMSGLAAVQEELAQAECSLALLVVHVTALGVAADMRGFDRVQVRSNGEPAWLDREVP